jgi:hypothetical protein
MPGIRSDQINVSKLAMESEIHAQISCAGRAAVTGGGMPLQ